MTLYVNPQNPPPGVEQNYNPGQVIGGNIGSITAALLEIATTMMQINSSYNEVAIESTQFQKDFNEEQCTSTREEGAKNAMGYWAQMGASLFSAICDAGTLTASTCKNSALNDQLKQQSNELKNLESNQGKMDNPMKNTEGDSELEDFSSLQSPAENPTAQIHNQRIAIQTTQSLIANNENRCRMFGDMLKQVGNSVSQGVQAVGSAQASDAKAAQMSAQFDQQTQSTVAQIEQKAISENFSQTLSVFQALAQAGAASV